MKNAISILALLALLFGLAGCGGTGSARDEVASVNTGMSSVSSMNVAADKVTMKITVAAVLVGNDGRIRACQLDEMETSAVLRDGAIVPDPDTRSNSEKHYDYGLAATSPIGREWFEQASALGDYVIGLTADEVASLPLSDGKIKDTVLATRCELDVTDFVDAITQAARSATARGASEADTLSMAISRTDESGSADRLHAAFQLSAVTLNPDGVVSSCLVDVSEAEATVKDGAFTGKNGSYPSNKGRRNDLMVETNASESVGWFEQAAAFEQYVTGKTLTQIMATPLTNGRAAEDTELSKTCFIPVAALLDNVIKSIEAAATTGETATPATTTSATRSQAESSMDSSEPDEPDSPDTLPEILESVAESVGDALSDMME